MTNEPRRKQPSLFDERQTDAGSTAGSASAPVTGPPSAAPAFGRHVPAVEPVAQLPDAADRTHAVDPRHNVVLEASAGTGKTAVLVSRYLNMLRLGVDPSNILAITFTRKAAAEMRERIIATLRASALTSPDDRRLWTQLRNRLGDVAISTIDAFCYGLLREFPLEADLDPGFSLADETETARLIEETLDQTLRAARRIALEDESVALLVSQLSTFRLRDGLAHLLQRRLVAWAALDRYVGAGDRSMTAQRACEEAWRGLLAVLERCGGGLAGFVADGPRRHPRFRLLTLDLEAVRQEAAGVTGSTRLRVVVDALAQHFLTERGEPRQRLSYARSDFDSDTCFRRHRDDVLRLAPEVQRVVRALARHLNLVLARGARRVLAIALREYDRVLAEYDVLDFSAALDRAVRLLAQMDEFAQSRYRLESRYHHVLLDEFQDTTRMQWQLVSHLVRSWGEGFGLVHEAPISPTVFLVGDRKQSIYRFRDAEVAVLDEAHHEVAALRQEGSVRRWISKSFRSTPEILAFANAVFQGVPKATARDDAFRFDERDRFPLTDEERSQMRAAPEPVLGLVVCDTADEAAAVIARDIRRLIEHESVRDPRTGVRRAVRPGDIGVLFRSRESHREVEQALEREQVAAYVYKGLGFFDADEVKDVSAAIRALANPDSSLHAAAFLRSRLVGVSDAGLRQLQPALAAALGAAREPAAASQLDEWDRRALALARETFAAWRPLVDLLPPAEIVDHIIADTAYAYETRGPRRLQARENLKKLRATIRRIQNHGYATLPRIADHLDRLSAGDESNAAVEALDAVSLMTMHAAKGLEFPVVFLVNLTKGAGGIRPAIRVVVDGGDGEPAAGVGSYQSDVDDVERAREGEEMKRLLYVAVTRARDRLYLSAVAKEGQVKPGRGSLAEVFPEGLREALQVARQTPGAAERAVSWVAGTGETFRFRVPAHPMAEPASELRPPGAD